MSKFEIGAKIREISSGDEGVITRNTWKRGSMDADRWYVRWTTGPDKGQELHLSEDLMELLQDSSEEVIENLRKLANSLGYDIVKI